MKRILLALSVQLSAFSMLGGPVYFPITEMTGLTNDVVVNVRAVNNPVVWNNRFYYLPEGGTNLTTSGGTVTNSFVPGRYTVTVAGLAQSWLLNVTNNTTAVSAADLSRGLTIYSGIQSLTGYGSATVTNDSFGNYGITATGGGTSGAITNHDTRDLTLEGALFTGQGIVPGSRLYFTNANYPGIEAQPVTSAARDLMTETTIPGAVIYNSESNRLQVATGSSSWATVALVGDSAGVSLAEVAAFMATNTAGSASNFLGTTINAATVYATNLLDASGNPFSALAATNNVDGWPLATSEWSISDGTINLDTLGTFASKVESNAPVKVMLIGDSLATPAGDLCGVAWGFVERLQRRLGGLNGAYHRAGNFTSTNGNNEVYQAGFTNGSAFTGGYYYDYTNYYGLVHPLVAGSYIEYKDAFYRNGNIPCDRIGIAWVANPLGAAMSVSNSANNGAYAKLGDIDGYAASPTYRWTNWTVALNTHKLKVQVSAGTNKLIGVTTSNTTATNGVSIMSLENPGANVLNISNCYSAIRSALTNFSPDLVIINMTDSADIGADAFRAGLTNSLKQLMTNVPNAGVLCMGVHWRLPTSAGIADNQVLRQACASNGWAFYDTAYQAGSYQKQTNITDFMADSVHLKSVGSLSMGDRLWAKLGLRWPTISTPTTGTIATQYQSIAINGARLNSGGVPTFDNLYPINGLPFIIHGYPITGTYKTITRGFTGADFNGATHFQFRLLFYTTNATFCSTVYGGFDLFALGTGQEITASRTVAQSFTVNSVLGITTNSMSYTPWSPTRTITTATTNWWGLFYMGSDNWAPTNTVWLTGAEVRYW